MNKVHTHWKPRYVLLKVLKQMNTHTHISLEPHAEASRAEITPQRAPCLTNRWQPAEALGFSLSMKSNSHKVPGKAAYVTPQPPPSNVLLVK